MLSYYCLIIMYLNMRSLYQCGVCGVSFTTPGSVRRHMVGHQVSLTYPVRPVLNIHLVIHRTSDVWFVIMAG
jgi:hypothetical protein